MFGSCGLNVKFSFSVLTGSGKRFDVEHDHGVVFSAEVEVLLVLTHVFPLSGNSGNNLRLAKVGQLFLEFDVPLPRELSIGGSLATSAFSALS